MPIWLSGIKRHSYWTYHINSCGVTDTVTVPYQDSRENYCHTCAFYNTCNRRLLWSHFKIWDFSQIHSVMEFDLNFWVFAVKWGWLAGLLVGYCTLNEKKELMSMRAWHWVYCTHRQVTYLLSKGLVTAPCCWWVACIGWFLSLLMASQKGPFMSKNTLHIVCGLYFSSSMPW